MRKLLSRTLLLASVLQGTVSARVEVLEIPPPRVSSEGDWLLPPCEGSEYLPIWTGCVGTRAEANGDRYVGEFWGGLAHGQGTLIFANGDRYVGECEYALPHGRGALTYTNGDQYVGEFWMGERHGRGRLSDANGVVREGIWIDDAYAHTELSSIFNREGNKYRDGIGVPQDYKEALRWYRLAADKQNKTAMLNIAHLYHHRKVTDPVGYARRVLDWWNEVDSRLSRSRIKAYMWADLAGNDLRDTIAEQLTPAEIEEARKLSAEWWINRLVAPSH